jgi:hypothetical protein
MPDEGPDTAYQAFARAAFGRILGDDYCICGHLIEDCVCDTMYADNERLYVLVGTRLHVVRQKNPSNGPNGSTFDGALTLCGRHSYHPSYFQLVEKPEKPYDLCKACQRIVSAS